MNAIAESGGVYSLLYLDIFVFLCLCLLQLFIAVIIARPPGFETWTMDGMNSPPKVGSMMGWIEICLRKDQNLMNSRMSALIEAGYNRRTVQPAHRNRTGLGWR